MVKFALTVAALACVTLFASSKYYLEPAQIAVGDQTIYVQLDEGVIEIDHLRVDQAGVYFEEENARCIDCRQPINPKNSCHKRLNPKNTCHKRLNPKNTCNFT